MSALRGPIAVDATVRRAESHLAAASAHAADDEWRECLEAYRAAILASNGIASTWGLRRHVVSGFTAVLKEQLRGQATADDIKLARRIGHGRYGDAAHVRVMALLVAGVMCFDNNDRAAAARSYRECLELEPPPTPDAQVFVGAVAGGPFRSARDLFAEAQSTALGNLESFETWGPRGAPENDTIPTDPDAISSPDELRAFTQRALRVSRSKECDECGRTSDVKMHTCSRCKERYYCSKECQVAAYNRPDGHRHTCRRAGRLKRGDLAQIRGLSRRDDLNFTIVKVLDDAPGPESAAESPEDGPDGTTTGGGRRAVRVLPFQFVPTEAVRIQPKNLVYLSRETRFRDRVATP